MCLDRKPVGSAMSVTRCSRSSIFWLNVPVDTEASVSDQLMGFSVHVNSPLLFMYRMRCHILKIIRYDKLLSVEWKSKSLWLRDPLSANRTQSCNQFWKLATKTLLPCHSIYLQSQGKLLYHGFFFSEVLNYEQNSKKYFLRFWVCGWIWYLYCILVSNILLSVFT